MADEKNSLESTVQTDDGSKNHWHPGFYGGVELELKAYKTALTFDIEHNLSKEPLKMDMLIIKKNSDVEIKNQLGVIFRKYNVIEYKSPDDEMSIDDYFKTVGYAYIFKGLGEKVDDIPLKELTVTLCRDVYPRELMKSIENNGGTITEKFPGIYYVTDLIAVPSQIVVTSELEGKEHAALRILSKNAKEEDVRQFLTDSSKFDSPGDINNANAVLQVSTTANKALYSQIRRDEVMCQALMEIMKDEIQEERDEVFVENIKSLMDSMHLSADEAMDALKVPAEKRQIFVVKL